MCILTVNAGSSSLKLALYDRDLRLISSKRCSGIDIMTMPLLRLEAEIIDVVGNHPISAIGHRVVHGGIEFCAPSLIDDMALDSLHALSPLAPLHQPPALRLIGLTRDLFTGYPQIACFDTAWHRTRPKSFDRFAIPQRLHDAGIQRYGFHGLSYEGAMEWLKEHAPAVALGRVVICHLGAGCSAAAANHGFAFDSTMGISTFHGLPMASRAGSIDAGVVLHLIRQGWDVDAVDHLLQKESGLLALSGGVTGDMRKLLEIASDEATFAVDYFCNEVARAIGGFAAVMGGIEALVFTGGIGENAPRVREKVCHRLKHLRILLDRSANERGETGRISNFASAIHLFVIPADEERMIAQHTKRILEAYRGD